MADHDALASMTAYDVDAWKAIHARIEEKRERKPRLPVPVSRRLAAAGESAGRVAGSVPGADALKSALEQAVEGVEETLVRGAHWSLSRERVLKAFAKDGHSLDELAQIRNLSLQEVDGTSASLALKYALASGAQGAAAGFAVSGGQAVAAGGTVLGAGVGGVAGAGVVITALVADAAATLLACRRAVGHVAMSYGYDPRLPEESVIAAQTLGVGLASGSAKAEAFRQLNNLVQSLARNKTWAELNKSAVTLAVRGIYGGLGFKLTQKKLGQAVPVLGIAIGAGVNARLVMKVVRDAQDVYRRRFLCEAYGLPFAADDDGRPADVPEPGEILEAELIGEHDRLDEPTTS
ncbi:EcsC family protein [Geodermatophilus sp. SYSU D00742]